MTILRPGKERAVIDYGRFRGAIQHPWAKEKLDQLLNHRYAHRLPTVIVSIVPVEELEDRARSRLNNTDFCQIYTIGSKPPALYSNGWAPWFELQKKMTFESFDWKRLIYL